MVKGSPLLAASFAAMALALAALFVLAVRRTAPEPRRGRDTLLAAAGIGAWLALVGGAAAAGRLTFDGRPPTMMVLVAATVVLAVALGGSRVGGRIAAGVPLAALVGAQAFRLPLELMMHRAYTEGLMPVQMSYSGRNFDIVTGATALVVAALLAAGRMPRWGVAAWNVVGTLLLLNIMAVAVLSTPTPLRVFAGEPANVWIAAFPWVYLPAVMVPAALVGHILVFRRLRHERAAAASTPACERNVVLA
ncbi:MAG TPA: hypothetical protein VHG91_13545 [Longimicrobium sp.]|nr:hypothetical protein [Longimicrobium sp.]